MGLVQHEIEKAGITTITLSNIPEFTASASVPRIAAIEYPFGRTVGMPGDKAGQTAVLQSVFTALETIQEPGEIIHLPFQWPEPARKAAAHDFEPPITTFLKKNIRLLPRYVRKEIPEEFLVD